MRTLSRILAATDFSPAGHAAVARAGQLAAQHNTELRLIHAAPDWNQFSGSTPELQKHYEDLSRNAEVLLKEEATWLAAEFAIHVVADTHRGKASEVIMRCVEAYQPTLLVVGARGEHAAYLTPAALGGTTLKLMTHAQIPLLLVRESINTPYKTSLAAIGPSGVQAKRIVRWASALTGADCHVVRAYDVPYLERLRLCGTTPEAIAKLNADLAARYAADPPWSKDELETQIHMHLIRGIPETVVLSEVARLSPQFVAVGRHEEAPLATGHPLMGCVGVRIAYHCPVDVLLVP